MNPKQFGQFISEERAAKGLTQKELAERLGVTDKAISKWERGVCLPDVTKFDDIAAALDLTDIEVLRAHRLAPEPESAAESAPPFVTWRELGTLLLAWLAVTSALFLPDVLEMRGLVHNVGLWVFPAPLLAGAFAVWYALRRAQGVTRVDRREVCIYALVCVVFFLLFVLLEDYVISLWLDGADKLFGLEGARFDYGGAWYDRINAYIPPWTPRWVLYWFLRLRIFDTGPMLALPLCAAVYPAAKLLRIRYNQNKQARTQKERAIA